MMSANAAVGRTKRQSASCAVGDEHAVEGVARPLEAERVADQRLVGHGRDLTKVADSFVRPREIQDALAAGNRDGLLDAAKQPFNRLSAQGALTQLAY